jgi:hypothetical protein
VRDIRAASGMEENEPGPAIATSGVIDQNQQITAGPWHAPARQLEPASARMRSIIAFVAGLFAPNSA